MPRSPVNFAKRPTTILGTLLAVVLVGAPASVARPAPVHAARSGDSPQATVFQGSDYASWGYGDLQVCDAESDGHSVYAQYSHNGYAGRVYDSSGSSGSCQNLGIGSPVVFRVCEQTAGTHWCSGWAHVTSAGEKIYQGSDDAAYHPYSNRQFVCDHERDGHSVYAEYWTSSGGHGKVTDANGSASHCGGVGADVWKFRVCEDVVGPNWCSDVVYTWDYRAGD